MLDQMELVREYTSMNYRLRQDNGITKSTMFLDFAFGNNKDDIYLGKDHRKLLGEAVEMYNLGYDFGDRLSYTLDNDIMKPSGEHWLIIDKDDLWFALDTREPDWLKEKNNERKQKRVEIENNKKLEK